MELTNIPHVHAVHAYLRLRILRVELISRWDRQMAAKGAIACSELGERPEEVCRQFGLKVKTCLDWYISHWQPLIDELEHTGFQWTAFFASTPPEAGDHAELNRIKKAVLEPVAQSFSSDLQYTAGHQTV